MGGSREETVQYVSCQYGKSQEDEGLVHPLEEKFGQKKKFTPFFLQMWLNKPDIPKVMKTHFK